MEDNREILLEYARSHGLARHHTSTDYQDIRCFVTINDDLFIDLADPEDAPTLKSPDDLIQPERLTLDPSGMKLLASVLRYDSSSMVGDDGDDMFDLRRCSKLKLDTPLLRTDPELDYRTFARSRPDEDLKIDLQMLHVDEESDEGLSWPAEQRTLPSKFNELCGTEKLEIPKEAVLWLRSALAGGDSVQDSEASFAEGLAYEKSTSLRHATPPLLPLTPPSTSLSSSPLLDNLTLLSDHTSPGKMEIEAIEQCLMSEEISSSPITQNPGHELVHNLVTAGFGLSESSSESHNSIGGYSSSPLRARASRLKIEEPLTPPTPIRSSKHVSWSDEIVHISPSKFDFDDDTMEAEAETGLAHLFDDIIEPQALQVEKQLHNELLQESGLTLKVPVPTMVSTIPVPPWKVTLSEVAAKIELAELMLPIAKMKCHHWSVSKIERDLPWSPFAPQMAQIAIDEQVNEVAEFLSQLGLEESIDIESLTWKREGLRILDEDDDEEDEELQPSVFYESRSEMFNLLEKRKRELDFEAAGNSRGSEILAKTATSSIHDSQERSAKSHPHHAADLRRLPLFEPTSGSFFSASNELDRFMGIQTGQAPKKRKLLHPPAIITPPNQVSPTTPIHLPPSTGNGLSIPQTHLSPHPFPFPATTPSITPRPIIVSSTLLHTRLHLIRHITRLYPSICLIPRDAPSAITSAPNLTANFAISPATGLICTTLQEIKQKPLPGQSSTALYSPIRTRILAIAPSFERLIVLVSQNHDGSSGIHDSSLDERDCTALNDLTGFAAASEHNIVVTFIPGGEEDLARWISGLISVDASVPEGVVLLQDVTLWELFLAKAGMNAFAAQAVLWALKAPAEVEGGGEEVVGKEMGREQLGRGVPLELGREVPVELATEAFGLSAFVMMKAEDRIARFEGLLGGRKVLERVGRVVDAYWGPGGGNRGEKGTR